MSEQAGEQQGGTGGEAQTGGTGTGATKPEPQVQTSGREAEAGQVITARELLERLRR